MVCEFLLCIDFRINFSCMLLTIYIKSLTQIRTHQENFKETKNCGSFFMYRFSSNALSRNCSFELNLLNNYVQSWVEVANEQYSFFY